MIVVNYLQSPWIFRHFLVTVLLLGCPKALSNARGKERTKAKKNYWAKWKERAECLCKDKPEEVRNKERGEVP